MEGPSALSVSDLPVKTDNNIVPHDYIVKLNVGGQMFQTTPTTLKESEFFTRMLEGSIPTLKDESGAYFIDRDPKYFEIILSFMRSFTWDIPPTMKKDRVLQEAEFYLLRTTEEIDVDLEEKKSHPTPGGLYTFKKDSYLFIYNGYFIAHDTTTKASVVVSKNVLSLKSQSDTTIGLFVNEGHNFIRTHMFTEPLKKNASRKPVKLFTQTIRRHRHPNITLKADRDIAVFYQNTQHLGDCQYETEEDTGLVFATHSSKDLQIKVYFFGDRVVVDTNGDWKYYTGDKQDTKEGTH